MFKYKISIYMKSGNVIYVRCKDCIIYRSSDNKSIEKINLIKSNIKDYAFIYNEIECIITKKWWQKWG